MSKGLPLFSWRPIPIYLNTGKAVNRQDLAAFAFYCGPQAS
jgi:hypothetical protein